MRKLILLFCIGILSLPVIYAGVVPTTIDAFMDYNNIEGVKDRTGNFTNTSVSGGNPITCEVDHCVLDGLWSIAYNIELDGYDNFYGHCWARNPWSGGDYQNIYHSADTGTGDTSPAIRFYNTNNIMQYRFVSGSTVQDHERSINVGDEYWAMYGLKLNSTHMTSIINDTMEVTPVTTPLDSITGSLYIGAAGSAGTGHRWEGDISSCMFVLKESNKITHSVIQDIYALGHDATYDDFLSDTLTINISYPIDYSFIDGVIYPFVINGSASSTTGLKKIVTNNSLFGDNVGTNESFSFENVSDVPQGNYSIEVTAINLDDENITYILNFTVDDVFPILTKNEPSSFDSYSENGIYINISATDDYELWSYNLTCLNSSNGILHSYYIEDLNVSTYSIRSYINWTNYTGVHSFDCYTHVYDSHTAMKIHKAKVDKLNNKMKFNYGNKFIEIELTESSDNLLSSSYEKKDDRYSYEFNFDKSKNSVRKFRIRSDSELSYQPNSAFVGHFVSKNHMWIDFAGSHNLEITKISNNEYEVIDRTEKSTLKYDSIGKLNYHSYNFTLNKLVPSEEESSSGGGGGYSEDLEELFDLDSQGTCYNYAVDFVNILNLFLHKADIQNSKALINSFLHWITCHIDNIPGAIMPVDTP